MSLNAPFTEDSPEKRQQMKQGATDDSHRCGGPSPADHTPVSPSSQASLELAKRAAQGEPSARREVNQLLHPLIDYQTNRFCKRFCQHNQYQYRCTLSPPMGPASADKLFCEWGNASYGWMLDDLGSPQRLNNFQARQGARLFDYFYRIANSLPFYERWKDWRFGRRVHVPTYIQSLSPHASGLFYGLRAGDELELVAQKLGITLAQAQQLASQIVTLLCQKNRLHLLNPPSDVPLSAEPASSGENHDNQAQDRRIELASFDTPIEQLEDQQRLKHAWEQLDAVEQFVLEALLIEQQDAEDVLSALRKLNISIKKGVAAEHTNRQQLYYFRRKSLSRLAELMNSQG